MFTSNHDHSQQVICQIFTKSVVHDWVNRDKKRKNITRTTNYYRNKGWYLCPSQSTCLQRSWCLSVCNWFGMDFKLIHFFTLQANQTQPKTKILTSSWGLFSETLDFWRFKILFKLHLKALSSHHIVLMLELACWIGLWHHFNVNFVVIVSLTLKHHSHLTILNHHADIPCRNKSITTRQNIHSCLNPRHPVNIRRNYYSSQYILR